MKTMNEAQHILARLNVYGAMMGTRVKYRGPTPVRSMRKGEDGMRKPDRYGKGLRNWITRKQAQERA